MGMRSIAWISTLLALATTVPSPTSALSLFGIPSVDDFRASRDASLELIEKSDTVDFDRLQSVQVTSVATGELTTLTSHWNNDEDLHPIQNQKCAVEFLRHLG